MTDNNNSSLCSTSVNSLPPLVVWIRTEHETEDEAIRIDLPHDAYVSDILIRAPVVMNLAAFRPVELQVVRNGAPLSNRCALATVMANDGSAPSAAFVVKPRGSAACPPPGAAPAPSTVEPEKQRRSRSQEKRVVSGAAVAARRPSTGHQPAVSLAVRCVLEGRPPPARAASPGKSHSIRSVSPQTVPHSARVQSSPVRSAVSATAAAAVRSTKTTAPTVSSQVSAPNSARRKDQPPSSNGHQIGGAKPSPASTPRQQSPARKTIPPSLPSAKVAPPLTAAPAASPPSQSTAAKVAHVAPCCSSFKAQWGNTRCATCKHSRQMHLMMPGRKTSSSPTREAFAAPRASCDQQPHHTDPNESLGSPIPSRDASGIALSSLDRLDHVA
jgi:hypothetical protein